MCGFNKYCDKKLMFLRYKPRAFRNLLAICKQILEVVKWEIDVFLEEENSSWKALKIGIFGRIWLSNWEDIWYVGRLALKRGNFSLDGSSSF